MLFIPYVFYQGALTNILEVNTIDEFYNFLNKYTETDDNLIYRGVRNSEFQLTPSIGRIKRKGNPLDVEEEKRLLKVFEHRSYPYTKEYKEDNLELLAIDQHHGLPTRLLDWTKNPLAAVFFAVEQEFTDYDKSQTEFSSIYIYKPKKLANLDATFDPFTTKEVKRFIPKHWDPRITSQGGLFTVHNDPYSPWTPKNLEAVKIHHSIRKQIKKSLNRLGMHAGVIYMDLDGICQHIRWLRSDDH